MARQLDGLDVTGTSLSGNGRAASKPSLVDRRSIAVQVAELLRGMILDGVLRPGEVITHAEISERLGVSTMPVREALIRLSHEGFIDAHQGRSFSVAFTTRGDIEDVYWFHGQLAGELAARACERGRTGLARELLQINGAWRDAGEKLDRLDELNERFHREINRAAGSPKLALMLRNSIRFIPDHFYKLIPSWRDLALSQHDAIAAAIEAGDAGRARAEMVDHVRAAGALLVNAFDGKGYWSGTDRRHETR